MTTLGTSSQTVTEYVVRVPKNNLKRYNIMAFNAADKVNFSTWHQAKMERDLSNKKIYQEEEMPESGAGSEFNRKLRDEARRKKYGIILKAFKAEDQPWLLKVNGKTGRRFKGVKKGGVTENTSYYIFTQCPDGAFEAFPVHNWYNFTPLARHRTLTAEEAEEEWERRNKVLNHFSIMQQRRLKDQDHDEDEEEHKEKKSRKKSSELRIHDLEDDLDMSSDDSNGSGEEGEKIPKTKKKAASSRGGKKKKKKGSDDEAFEDSDDGDFEGQEVDYMSDGSSSSQDEAVGGKPKVVQQEEDGPKGIDEESESSEESEEDKPPEEEEKEEEDKKAPTLPEKKRRKGDSSEESETSEESDIDNEASSALFMTKKKTPPKRERRASGSSSRGDSRPSTPSVDSGSTSSTLRAAANKLEQGKRQTGPSDTPAAKRLRLDAGPQSISGKSTPQPQSGKSTPSSGDVQVTEDAVRRYLTRKPMTTKDLLKKFQTKKTGLSSDQTVNVLAQILKRLNPERKMINDKMHFSLKE
ncbi:general transcription factor IIF subunit 1 [Dromiciops gliroides]|uniref:general transcription factor IIF subunit 1 n=1 Tax=Dromiciops gliroides TaxID=33562 RepID=UPI001CC48DA6|nr:general transcription factor IIF subunit 1 [Dromiciops gliroides]XP_043838316.1 general transcription factor IIF subunit 1 [Dromiciops gliroides]